MGLGLPSIFSSPLFSIPLTSISLSPLPGSSPLSSLPVSSPLSLLLQEPSWRSMPRSSWA